MIYLRSFIFVLPFLFSCKSRSTKLNSPEERELNVINQEPDFLVQKDSLDSEIIVTLTDKMVITSFTVQDIEHAGNIMPSIFVEYSGEEPDYIEIKACPFEINSSTNTIIETPVSCEKMKIQTNSTLIPGLSAGPYKIIVTPCQYVNSVNSDLRMCGSDRSQTYLAKQPKNQGYADALNQRSDVGQNFDDLGWILYEASKKIKDNIEKAKKESDESKNCQNLLETMESQFYEDFIKLGPSILSLGLQNPESDLYIKTTNEDGEDEVKFFFDDTIEEWSIKSDDDQEDEKNAITIVGNAILTSFGVLGAASLLVGGKTFGDAIFKSNESSDKIDKTEAADSKSRPSADDATSRVPPNSPSKVGIPSPQGPPATAEQGGLKKKWSDLTSNGATRGVMLMGLGSLLIGLSDGQVGDNNLYDIKDMVDAFDLTQESNLSACRAIKSSLETIIKVHDQSEATRLEVKILEKLLNDSRT